MTTREQIIAAVKEAGFPEWENTDDPEFLKVIEKLYVVAFQSGADGRDAEVAELKQQIDSIKLSTPSLDAIGVLAPHPRTLMENYRKVLQAEHDAEIAEYKHERDQLRAQINNLLEAMGRLEKYVSYNGDTWVQKEARNALATTPEQSLAEYRNKVVDSIIAKGSELGVFARVSGFADALRAMKEQP